MMVYKVGFVVLYRAGAPINKLLSISAPRVPYTGYEPGVSAASMVEALVDFSQISH